MQLYLMRNEKLFPLRGANLPVCQMHLGYRGISDLDYIECDNSKEA